MAKEGMEKEQHSEDKDSLQACEITDLHDFF